MELALKLSRIGLRIVGTILGSLGVLCVSFSWLGPNIAMRGIICLLAALAITYALDAKR
jgi:protein-S-isoprenylcysteine O-methyltransferase Ste14